MPVTLPTFAFAESDAEAEACEAAARVAERKAIRAGLDAWRAIGKAESFESWKIIGAALSIGKAHALRVTGANRAWGQNYSRVFCEWMKEHGFNRMPKGVRSLAIELNENIIAVEQWRMTLSEKERIRLQGPQQTLRRWKVETGQVTQSKRPRDTARAAMVAFDRFVSLVQTLPPDQAAPLWQAVHAEAAAHIRGHP